MVLPGALFGGMAGGAAMRHGRRRVLSLAAAPCSLSWLLTTVATSVRMMCITAFLGGFCCSILTMLSQVSFCMCFYFFEMRGKMNRWIYLMVSNRRCRCTPVTTIELQERCLPFWERDIRHIGYCFYFFKSWGFVVSIFMHVHSHNLDVVTRHTLHPILW